jgi:comEA protein
MKDPEKKNNPDDIFKRSYRGSLFILFFLFVFFIYKTSLCSKTFPDIDFDNPAVNVSENPVIEKTIVPDVLSDSSVDSNKYTQKKEIKELTVTKKLVNINTASVDELTGLKGIGKKTAQKIVNYRNETGSFETTEDIMKVKGIGKAKYSAIRDYIILK